MQHNREAKIRNGGLVIFRSTILEMNNNLQVCVTTDKVTYVMEDSLFLECYSRNKKNKNFIFAGPSIYMQKYRHTYWKIRFFFKSTSKKCDGGPNSSVSF